MFSIAIPAPYRRYADLPVRYEKPAEQRAMMRTLVAFMDFAQAHPSAQVHAGFWVFQRTMRAEEALNRILDGSLALDSVRIGGGGKTF